MEAIELSLIIKSTYQGFTKYLPNGRFNDKIYCTPPPEIRSTSAQLKPCTRLNIIDISLSFTPIQEKKRLLKNHMLLKVRVGPLRVLLVPLKACENCMKVNLPKTNVEEKKKFPVGVELGTP